MQKEEITRYIFEVLGVSVMPKEPEQSMLKSLPMFFGSMYFIYQIELYGTPLLCIEPKTLEGFSIGKIEKHIEIVRSNLQVQAILIVNSITAITRKRLINKHINFIVPGKQLFLPSLLICLQERFSEPKPIAHKLLPSAQAMIIYWILNRNAEKKLEQHSFKEIANLLGYSAMAITKAAANLKLLQIIQITGGKDKYIRFNFEVPALWQYLETNNLLTTPVLKQVYTDELPTKTLFCKSFTSALSEYTDMNPSRQPYIAIEKTEFGALQKANAFKNLNHYEGKYCLEVWKYDPLIVASALSKAAHVADPLSVYLSLKHNTDERIDMAKEQIIEKYIW